MGLYQYWPGLARYPAVNSTAFPSVLFRSKVNAMNRRKQIHRSLIDLRKQSEGETKTLIRRAIDEWERMENQIMLLLGPDNRSVESEFNDLMRDYSFTRIDDKWARSRTDPCVECTTFGPSLDCDNCDGTREVEYRADWVNASRVYEVEVDGYFIQLAKFDKSYSREPFWFTVEVYATPYAQDPVTLRSAPPLVAASTTSWDGEKLGSGIPRVPEDLRGFMYRCPVGESRDAHCRPDDIVVHLLRWVRSWTAVTARGQNE